MRSRNFHVKNDGSIAHSLNTDTVEYLLGSMTGAPKVTPELMARYGQGTQAATESMWDKSLVHIGQDNVHRSSLVEMAKKQGKPASIPRDRTGYARSNAFDEDANNPIVAVDYQGTGEHYDILAGFVAYRQANTPMIDVLLVTEKDLQDLIGRTKSVMYETSAESFDPKDKAVTVTRPIDVQQLDMGIVREYQKHPDILKAVASYLQLADRQLEPMLRKAMELSKKLHKYPQTLTVFRGFDNKGPQETLGLKNPKVGDVIAFDSSDAVIPTSRLQSVSRAFGSILVQIELNADKDSFLVIDDELYYAAAVQSGAKTFHSQQEVVILPPVAINATVVDVVSGFISRHFGPTSAVKRLVGASTEAYQEEQSYFEMDGKRYDLNKIFQMVEGARVRQVSVRKVDWVLDFDKPDPTRVENADIRVPIIVTPYKGGVLLPVDGLHRIARGVEEGASQLPAYVITRAQLEQALIS